MRDDSYVVILPWMVSELGLKGNELIIYAIIHGFTMADCSFNGSLKYLMDWTGSTSKPNTIKILKSLTEKGLVKKDEKFINGVKFCEYTTVVRKTNDGGSDLEPRWFENRTGGGSKIEPNNIEDNIDDIKSNKRKNTKKESFVPPTLEEVESYVKEKGLSVKPSDFYNYFTEGNWIDSKGNKVKSWKQKLLTWENMRKPAEKKQIGEVL